MISAKKNTTCRYCGSSNLTKFLSLGNQPPANSFLRPDQIAEEANYPLDVYWCLDCCLVQLLDVVPASLIFDDYHYLSSTSKALKEHYGRLAQWAVDNYHLKTGDVVVDIGCNDGVTLQGYPKDLKRIGVEPSKVAEIARTAGFEVYKTFFNSDCAKEIAAKHGPAKVATATNVFAHVDDIQSFTKSLIPLLADDGVFIIEAPYLVDLIDSMLFDTIYHEHLCYLSLTPMVPFFARCGLEIFDVIRVPFGASGPAIRVFSQKKGGPHPVQPRVQQMLEAEERWGIRRAETYQGYARRVEGIKQKIQTLMKSLLDQGVQIGGYGAPAKGMTLLNYVGITTKQVACIAETNKLKQGTLAPGSHIPIVSEEEFLGRKLPYALLLSWNYLDFFLKNSDYVRQGGKFVVPLPEPSIAPQA